MNEQKNKQQPEQGNEKKQGGTDKGGMTGNQSRDNQGMQSPTNPGARQQKGSMADTHRQQPMGSDIENPDKENDPEKKINIDDDPDQTKRKVPNIGK